jgi:hypothetical protein
MVFHNKKPQILQKFFLVYIIFFVKIYGPKEFKDFTCELIIDFFCVGCF